MPPVKSRSSSVTGSYEDGTTHLINVVTMNASQDILVTSAKGRGSDHAFEAAHGLQTGSIMNGKLGAINNFMNCPAAFYSGTPIYNSLSLNMANITALLAITNPSRPDVLLPVFAFELRDLPDMLRQAGRIAKRIYFERGSWSNLIRPGSVHRDMAAANLAIQFGWQPLVSDIWKIATLQNSVEKRRKELKKLRSPRGLRRRVQLGSTSTLEQGTAQVWSTHGIGLVVGTRTVNTLRAWGTARWRAQDALPPWVPTDGELRRQLTGLTPDAILLNVWEALPWSWLVDWFIPIQQTIQAANRTVGIPVSACVMQERTTTTLYDGRVFNQGFPIWNITPGQKTSVIHHRAVMGESVPSNRSSIPLLGSKQLSILGSLAILRAR